MHPGALLSDVGHLQHVRIQACFDDGPAKGRLVQAWRAGGHYHAIKLELGNIFLDLFLADVGAGELQIAGYGNIGQLLGKALQVFHVQDAGDIQAAVTNVNTSGHETS